MDDNADRGEVECRALYGGRCSAPSSRSEHRGARRVSNEWPRQYQPGGSITSLTIGHVNRHGIR
jgi:hypothetical protein